MRRGASQYPAACFSLVRQFNHDNFERGRFGAHINYEVFRVDTRLPVIVDQVKDGFDFGPSERAQYGRFFHV